MVPSEMAAVCHRLEHRGRLGELAPLLAGNALRVLMTLGGYKFWGTARVRRYLWSRTSFDGDPLEWTGTGWEMCRGFLVAFLLILLPLSVLGGVARYLILHGQAGSGRLLNLGLSLIYLSLWPMGLYAARRYRLSRTRWRGIRGTQTGSALSYALTSLVWSALTIASAGLLLPLRSVRLTRYRLNHTVFGDRGFSFAPRLAPLYGRFLSCYGLWLVGMVVAVGGGGWLAVRLGNPALPLVPRLLHQVVPWAIWVVLISGALIYAFYKSVELRQFAAATRWGELSFRLSFSFRQWLGLLMGNGLIVFFTLGLGLGVAQMRRLRFVARHLEILGRMDFAQVQQNRAAAPHRGEGLAGIFDGVDF